MQKKYLQLKIPDDINHQNFKNPIYKKVLSRNGTGNKKGVCHVLRDVNRKRFESSKVEDSL